MSEPNDAAAPGESGSSGASSGDPAGGIRRCGFIAIIGAPNAGKSTLVNALVGTKIAIVSRKVQTTRVPVRGIAIEGPAQLVFIDTPGLFSPRRRLDRAMVEAAATAATDADIVAFVVDAAKGLDDETLAILSRLEGIKAPKLLVLNKVDRLRQKEDLLKLSADINSRMAFERTFMISAETGVGVSDLRTHLARLVPVGPWHYPEDEITDATERATAAEITRERIYDLLHDELPYAITVETTQWKELRDGGVRIEQTIFVAREGHRRIVVGEKARMVRQISMEARAELARIFERPVHLFLFVKVREGWEDDPERYREMGLDYPKD
jgi:GTPase